MMGAGGGRSSAAADGRAAGRRAPAPHAPRAPARPRLLTAPGARGPGQLGQTWAAQAPMLTMETVPGPTPTLSCLDPGHAANVARRLTEALRHPRPGPRSSPQRNRPPPSPLPLPTTVIAEDPRTRAHLVTT